MADLEELKEFGHLAIQGGLRIVCAAVFMLVGVRIVKWFRKGVGRSMERAGLEITLRKFLDALLYAALLGLLTFTAAEWLGVRTASIVALVGTAGLALSLSMQNTLENFAGGVLILFLKPFKVGDYIITQDGEGTVESIGLVYTTILPLDNRKIIIPNNNIANSPVTNVTGAEKRRVVLDLSISYSSDLEHAKELLYEIFEESPLILQEDGIVVVVTDFAQSGVVVSARGWTETENIWLAGWELREKIKLTFDQEGVELSYNCLNVHVKEDSRKGDRT